MTRSFKAFTCLCFTLSVLTFGNIGAVLATDSTAASDPGVELDQIATDGTLRVRATATAVRIDKGNGLFYIISKAPKWDINVILPKKKEIAFVTNYFWCIRHEVRPMTWAGALGKPLRQQTFTRDGDNYVKYHFGTTPVPTLYLQSGVGNQDTSKEQNRAEMVCLQCAGADKSGPVTSRLQSLPPIAGLPISAIRFRPHMQPTFLLNTKKVNSHVRIPRSIFVIPQGYKPIKFDIGVLMPEGQAENTKDFFKEFL